MRTMHAFKKDGLNESHVWVNAYRACYLLRDLPVQLKRKSCYFYGLGEVQICRCYRLVWKNAKATVVK